jgi:FemAB family protein
MIKDQLIKVIQNVVPDSNIDSNSWQSVIEQHKTIPSIFHLFNTVEYYVAYYSKKSSINLSLVVYNNMQPVGVMPLMIHKNEHNEWILSSNGVEIVEPIFIQTLARKVKKRLELQLTELIYTLSSNLGIKYCQFANMEYAQLSDWYLLLTEKASEIFTTHHLLVDLSLSLDEIRLKFRKSFKPLVNKGLREWEIKVHEQVSEEIFDRFRSLHKEVSGRSTRPIESWDKQRKQIDSLESFLIIVSDTQDQMVGAGLFTYSSYQGFYCVGAYKRELFDKPIGHAVQMKAIETLKKNGVLWYEIGQKHLKIDKVPATDKELSISHFKEGFCTHVIARQHLIVKML